MKENEKIVSSKRILKQKQRMEQTKTINLYLTKLDKLDNH